jgi:hypothetical protein
MISERLTECPSRQTEEAWIWFMRLNYRNDKKVKSKKGYGDIFLP